MSGPFDETRYRGLLEGLEIAEIPLSELERTFRIDAEFFHKRHLEYWARIERVPHESVNLVAHISDGNHFSISDRFQEEGIPYYRGQDVVGHFFVEQSSPVCIDAKTFNEAHLHRSHLKKGDVLLSIVGTIGELSLVTSDEPATCSCKLAILRPKKIPSAYLAAFLACEYGNSQIRRYTRGAVQMGLLLEDMDQIHVPRYSPDFENAVASFVEKARLALEDGNIKYRQAENTLLAELGLLGWQPPESLSYERKASEAFAVARLDAEHFQPKYLDLLERLGEIGCPIKPLAELIRPILNGYDHRDFIEDGTPYIRVGDIKRGRINLDGAERIAITAGEVSKDIALKIGDILFTRKGSYGNSAVVEAKHVSSVISSEIMLLRLNEQGGECLIPEYLSLFLNSKAGYMQVERWVHGAAFYSIAQDDMVRLEIPLLPLEKQEPLAVLLEASKQMEKAAQTLLDRAKRAVEIAIETGESAALEYLNGIAPSPSGRGRG